MNQVGVGISTHRDARVAGKSAAEDALKQAGVTSCDYVMMFATVGYPPDVLLKAVRGVTGDAPLTGCGGKGVITQRVSNESNHAVVVMVWKSDELRFTNSKARNTRADSHGAGAEIARALGRIPDDVQALFVFGDGLAFNFDQFERGFKGAVDSPRVVPMIGGTSQDNLELKQMHVYHNDEVFSDGVSTTLLAGTGHTAFQVNHGCVPLGHELTVTRSEGNVILEIDHKPATAVLREYLGDEMMAPHATAFVCLGWRLDAVLAANYDEYIARYITSIDHERGSITIQTDISPGTKVRMTRRDAEKMYRGVEQLGSRLKDELAGNQAKAVLHIDCASRGSFMFSEEQKTKFITRLQETFDPNVPWIGFYSSGEIAPVGGANCFHNFTVAIAAIY
jgi:hypothetical protein